MPGGRLHGIRQVVPLADLARTTSLGGQLEKLRDRSVVLLTKDQLTAALALIELDGVARRMVLCPPDLQAEHVPAVMRDSEAEACIFDATSVRVDLHVPLRVTATPQLIETERRRQRSRETEWVLLTSGTTGAPKLVLHSFESLMSALKGSAGAVAQPPIWSTFYDIRRYGGLQVFLRGVHAGSLVLSDPAEAAGDFLSRAAAAGVTHIYSASRTSQGPSMKKRVREMALRAARDKAQQIAQSLGVKLGPVQSVRESQYESWAGYRGWSSGMDNNVASTIQPTDQPERAGAPDAIQLHLGLQVSFSIL